MRGVGGKKIICINMFWICQNIYKWNGYRDKKYEKLMLVIWNWSSKVSTEKKIATPIKIVE